MKELDRLPPELLRALSGGAFRRRRRLVLPLLTADAGGFPRAALLTPGEVRANSATELAVAVLATSRTAVNLIRRRRATLLYLHPQMTAMVQARAGRGCVCPRDPERHLFPLLVHRVRIDHPPEREGDVRLLAGPTFTGGYPGSLFRSDLFEDLGRVHA
ncbi:MAG TPA: hypothetical protein VIA45_07555 [Thermoanaerobaculia bacterium]|jgi:hypothetical protein